MSEYAERALDELGDHYYRHVNAMTEEKLHSKSSIAAELAWRDQRIAELERLCPSEILAALPYTADGAPIIPGMTVHCLVGEHADERKVIAPYGKAALLTYEPQRHGAGPGECHRLANTVYVIRENAIKAAQKVPSQPQNSAAAESAGEIGGP